MENETNTTPRGTPIAKSWPRQWVKTLTDAEQQAMERQNNPG